MQHHVSVCTHTNHKSNCRHTASTGGVQPGSGRLLFHQVQHIHTYQHTKHAHVVQMHIRHRWCTTWLWKATSPSSATSYQHTHMQNTWSKCTFDTGGVQPGCGRLLLHQAQHHTNACTHTKHARVVQMHVRHRWCTTWLWEATSPSSATSYQHIHTYKTRTRNPIAHSTQVVYNLVVGGYFSIKRNIMSVPTNISVTHDQMVAFNKALLEVFRWVLVCVCVYVCYICVCLRVICVQVCVSVCMRVLCMCMFTCNVCASVVCERVCACAMYVYVYV